MFHVLYFIYTKIPLLLSTYYVVDINVVLMFLYREEKMKLQQRYIYTCIYLSIYNRRLLLILLLVLLNKT